MTLRNDIEFLEFPKFLEIKFWGFSSSSLFTNKGFFIYKNFRKISAPISEFSFAVKYWFVYLLFFLLFVSIKFLEFLKFLEFSRKFTLLSNF